MSREFREPVSSGEIERARTKHHNPGARMYLRFRGETAKTFEVLVDNRGGPDVRVSVGEYEQPVKAGDTPHLVFPYMPRGDQADIVRFNGETVGRLNELLSADTDAELLLDTSGSRCYRYESQMYSNSEIGISSHGIQVLRAQKLRPLSGHVTHFLAPLPGTVWSSDQMVVKGSLLQIPCH